MIRALWASLLALALCVAPSLAAAQQPGAGQMVVVLPFSGRATQDVLTEAEDAVRAALLSRGAQAPDRATVNQALGVTPPTDAANVVAFARGMGGTHAVTGVVTPLAGQFNLALTLYEVSSGRSARREANVGHGEQPAVDALMGQLFAPDALGAAPPTPVDPEAARRAEEERRRAEEQRRADEARRAEEARRQAATAAQRAREAYERAHPLRSFDAGGPIALGARLTIGAVLSGTRESATVPPGGTQPPEPTSLAAALRLEGGYAIRAVPGLEVYGGVMVSMSPSSALGFGAGAEFTFPARSRLGLRATAGVLVGLFQGLSGARITSAWLAPHVRAEYALSQAVAVNAGLELDVVPGSDGGFTALSALVGVRFRMGD